MLILSFQNSEFPLVFELKKRYKYQKKQNLIIYKLYFTILQWLKEENYLHFLVKDHISNIEALNVKIQQKIEIVLNK